MISKIEKKLREQLYHKSSPPGYKFFMLNSAEHKISTPHKTKIPTNEEVTNLKSLRCCINHANKC